MTKIIKSGHNADLPAKMAEVEFALVLSRIINNVKGDPEQLRNSVYELARFKLRSEIPKGDPDESEHLTQALETAIKGVEDFSRRHDQGYRASRVQPNHPLPANRALPGDPFSALTHVSSEFIGNGFDPPRIIDANLPPQRRRRGFYAWTLVALLFLAAGATWKYTGSWPSVSRLRDLALKGERTSAARPASSVQSIAPSRSAAPPDFTLAAPDPQPSDVPLPTSYGTYAVADGKPVELELLAIAMPDKRVAISSPINTPSKTTLPDGLPTFIVFRRDLANLTTDRIEARVVAKIKRTMKIDPNAKTPTFESDDSWSIRNVTYPFKISPVPASSEMILLQPENADAPLPPGRYVLALKRQAYDFTVAGKVTDPNQCLERVEATNGTFYSSCQKP